MRRLRKTISLVLIAVAIWVIGGMECGSIDFLHGAVISGGCSGIALMMI